MEKKIELLENLVKEIEKSNYEDDNINSVIMVAELLLRKIFGENSMYISRINNIRFLPPRINLDTDDEEYKLSFEKGKNLFIQSIKIAIGDLEYDMSTNLNTIKPANIIPDSKKVFIVHGHNEHMKSAIARTLEKLRITPIILHEQANGGRTIIEKFTENSDVIFAIVLLSGDDFGYSKASEPDTKKLRARQNVIFELGYFIGKLGRDRVVALYEADVDIELPSDYVGVVFVPFDKHNRWQFEIVKEMKAAGIQIDANDIV